MTLARIALAALGTAVLGACGDGGGGDSLEWVGTVIDSAGVAIVSNPQEGTWTQSSRWTVVEELRIGTTEGDPDYQFGQISGIGVASDGRIFVLDQQAAEVRVFSPDGLLENKFGRPGSGPGELGAQGAGPLLVGAGDTIFVPDLANQRVVRFSPAGEALGSFRLDLTQGIPLRWEVNDSGRLVSHIRHFPLPGQVAEPDTMDAIVERDSDGTILDTLLSIPAGRTFSAAGGRPEFHFFSAEPAWALAPDGHILFGVNDDYRIGMYDHAGRLERVIAKDFERQEVTGTDEDVFTEAIERAWTNAGVPRAALSQLRSAISYEQFFPVYLQFLSGPAQSLWVQHLNPPSNLTEEQRENLNPQLGFGMGAPDWDVFDAEGRYLGVVTMPERYQPLRFVGDQVYGVWRDELDVQYVMKMRVIGVPRAGGGGDTGAVPIGAGG